MAKYDYQCERCDTVEELSFPMGEAPNDTFTSHRCPDGLSGRMFKRFFPVAVSFKGGGFYRTDSRLQRKSAVAKFGGTDG